ncbi:unnamed protein product, partial [Adineta ricciae]
DETCKYLLESESQYLIKTDSQPTSIVIGDFNNDGLNDFVTSNSGSNTIQIFLEQNDNSIIYSTGSNSKPNSITIADFNQDQTLDIAVANFGTNNIGIFLGQGNGTFISWKPISLGKSRSQWISNEDLNNDSFIDLVTVNHGTDDMTIFIGNGKGDFQKYLSLSTGYDSSPYSLMIKNLNNDQYFDLIVANSGTNHIGIFFGKTNGTFNDEIMLNTGVNSHP